MYKGFVVKYVVQVTSGIQLGFAVATRLNR